MCPANICSSVPDPQYMFGTTPIGGEDWKRVRKILKIPDILVDLCRNGNCEDIVLLDEILGLTPDDFRGHKNRSIVAACEQGHLEIVKYIHEVVGVASGDFLCDNIKSLESACASGNLELVKYFNSALGMGIREFEHSRALLKACDCGHVHIIQYLRDEIGFTVDDLERVCKPVFQGNQTYEKYKTQFAREEISPGENVIITSMRNGFTRVWMHIARVNPRMLTSAITFLSEKEDPSETHLKWLNQLLSFQSQGQ